MSQYKKAIVGVSEIKTDYYQPENTKEFLSTLGVLLKTIFPLEIVVVHKSTMQLIANGHYLQLAIQEGKEKMEVVLADFPEEELLHTIATHWKPSKRVTVIFPLIAPFMQYYNLKKGDGGKYREGMEDSKLRELVAEVLGTNRTYLDWIETIGNFNPQLLNMVDAQQISLKEAFSMIPKTSNQRKNGEGDSRGAIKMKNHLVRVTDISDLSNEELETLTTNLPSFHAEQIGNGILPEGLSISKCFTYNETFQGFAIVYERDGKSIITHIAYTEDMRMALMKAA